jgi:hypothetical protein
MCQLFALALRFHSEMILQLCRCGITWLTIGICHSQNNMVVAHLVSELHMPVSDVILELHETNKNMSAIPFRNYMVDYHVILEIANKKLHSYVIPELHGIRSYSFGFT